MLEYFFLFISLIQSKNYAILFNGSSNYFNYRHNTNILLLYNLLLKNKYTSDEIILLTGEKIHEDMRNIDKDHIYLNDKMKIKKDKYCYEDATLQSLLNIINLNHNKLLDCDKNSNLLIYLCGHGNQEFLKIKYREAIYTDDFSRCINNLSQRVNKILVIVDTCHAFSFVPKNIPSNVFYMATSKMDEPSVSSNYSNKLGVYCVDNFMFYLHKLMLNFKMNLVDFCKLFTKEILKSTMLTKGNKNFFVGDFFTQKEKIPDESDILEL